MGQHKTNPNSILKAQGLLEPKKKIKKPTRKDLYTALIASLMAKSMMKGSKK